MSNRNAIRVGLNLRTKSIAGIPFRLLVRKSWGMTTEQFWDYQYEQFKAVYNFARNNIPYYQKNSGIYPVLPSKPIHILELLKDIPILTKQTVKRCNADFWARPISPLIKFHTTSGTSGTPLRLSATLGEKGFAQAVYEEWLLHICGSRIPKSFNLSGFVIPSSSNEEIIWSDGILGHRHISIYSLNSSHRNQIISLFKQHKPKLIWGYASAIHQLALLLEDSVQSSKQERVAIVTSEILQPDWRITIENALCRKVFDYYSSQEKCHEVRECEAGRMHINPLVGIVEILDEHNQTASPGTIGRVVVTGLVRKSMPLIRYEIGDVAQSTGYATDCSCGLKWPTIGEVNGRAEDLVKTRDGRSVGYLCFHATKELKGIKESQIVQKDYEQFICNIVKTGGDVEEDYLEKHIRQQIIKRLQVNVNVNFNYLSEIHRGPNGKFKAVIVDFEKDKVVG